MASTSKSWRKLHRPRRRSALTCQPTLIRQEFANFRHDACEWNQIRSQDPWVLSRWPMRMVASDGRLLVDDALLSPRDVALEQNPIILVHILRR